MSDIRYTLFRIYQKMPVAVGTPVARVSRRLPRQWLLGKEFVEWEAFLKESQWWSKAQTQAYQDSQIRALVAHAYENVPFYAAQMRKRGVRPQHIETTADLCKLPVITRDDIAKNYSAFLARGFDSKRLTRCITGGSTGTPFELLTPSRARIVERAFINRVWNWAGYGFGDPAIRIRARSPGGKRHFFDAVQNTYEFFPLSIDAQFAETVAQTARKLEPKAIFGYASYLASLAKWVEELGLQSSFSSVRVFFAGSEKVFRSQRQRVSSVFQVPLVEWYGMSEMVALFGQCEHGGGMHDFPEYGFVEFLDEHGERAPVGQPARVIGTSFLNYAMPLIRYAVGDIATASDKQCACGRSFRLVGEVQGRMGDFIVTPTGKLVAPTALEFVIDDVHSIREYQIVQTQRDEIVVSVVPDAHFTPAMAATFVRGIERRLGEPMKVRLREVDKIDRPKSQKTRLVVSTFGQAFFDGSATERETPVT